MTWPGIAVGYDGQGYFYDSDYDGEYKQRGKGVYVLFGRELFIEGLQLNIGFNINDFSKTKVYGFLGATVPIYRDIVSFMAEYDNVNYFPDARLNAGLRFTLTETIDIDFVMRDCWGRNWDDRLPNERVFKVGYTGKF
jgi:hypothetical protein